MDKFDLIYGLVSTVLGYLGVLHLKGRTADAAAKSVRSVLEEAFDEQVSKWLASDAPRLLDLARQALEDIATEELARIGVPSSAAIDLLVHELVSVAYGKLRRQLEARAAKALPGLATSTMATVQSEAQATLDAIAIANPLVPPITTGGA